ncbi:STAS/SEC14 domain-containing protein [Zunongwangia sp. F260]|uniref:STAS/SEC14 domain-containing protein n=1 Tax=Autumnicola lenta TaxID=3075593 RepID=A0ABU3CGW8_9FLAO|nr:STAS/SEC14 domain-containing protein [Zunongwangia sp. F260]MDT0645526.1 STAS/SEC14 domain-containing protein [Zunongwangia sp. F260]
MIKQIETPADILGLEMSGKLKKEDFDKMKPLLEEHQKEKGSIKLLVIYHEFEWPTTEALKEDLKSYYNYDFEKIAFVSNTKLLREAADNVLSIMPGELQWKGFEPGEKKQAINWLQNA